MTPSVDQPWFERSIIFTRYYCFTTTSRFPEPRLMDCLFVVYLTTLFQYLRLYSVDRLMEYTIWRQGLRQRIRRPLHFKLLFGTFCYILRNLNFSVRSSVSRNIISSFTEEFWVWRGPFHLNHDVNY
jgi:hypothetical protein